MAQLQILGKAAPFHRIRARADAGKKKTVKKETGGQLGFWAVTAIGIGGMVGGGIFAVLGLAVQFAEGGTPLAFLVAGGVALLTSYSYARLSVRYPSQGGTVIFIDRAFGIDLFTGSLNNLLWLSYIVMLALYAYAFGSFGATFFPHAPPILVRHLLISAALVGPTLLNLLNADWIGRAETAIVAAKVALLLFFVAVGLPGIDAQRLAAGAWAPPMALIAGGMIIFLAYEGFELIANTAHDVRNAGKILPRAYYSAVLFVILLYFLVALVTVGVLPLPQIAAARDYALAEAARPMLGGVGFRLIAVAALLSTLSAINATLYGAARLSYTIAKEGELPEFLEKKVWCKPLEGLLITSALALLLANLADLHSISLMGSAGFLIIFATVNGANMVKADETGSRCWLAGLGLFACLAALAALVWQTATTRPGQLWVLAGLAGGAFAIEAVYQLFRRRLYLA
jgi:amino acid transporter